MAQRIRDFRYNTAGTKRGFTFPNRVWRCARRFIFRSCLTFFAASVIWVVAYAVFPVPFTPLMVIRGVESVARGRPLKFEKDWVSIEQISDSLKYAVVAAEDAHFFDHSGFDWDAIEKALRHNRRSSKLRGASTISQQVAKNVFLWPQRSWVRKGFEAYFTGLIEIIWTKDRILEVYLNIAELGDGVYGVEAASRKYFGKSASTVHRAEAALMAAILPSPRRFQIRNPSRYVRSRQTLIQRRMAIVARAHRASIRP